MAMVGAAADAIVGGALSKLSAFIQEKASMTLGVRDDLKKLLRKLERLKIFLVDAESKSIQDPFIRSWLGELKDFIYDADDVIDLCRIEGTNLLEGDQPSTSTQPSRAKTGSCFSLMSCFSAAKFRYEIAEQIKSLNVKLKEIVENKPTMLKEVTTTMHSRSFNNRQTSPEMPESDYVGADVEKATQDIVTSLIEESESRTKCRVWGIVGMGGIGKNTLASKVYNHPSIVNHFTIRIWVCISQTFSETDILKQIIKGAGAVVGEASSKAELDSKLISSLSSKFLIVLDDVWSSGVWENSLRSPLEKCGAPSGWVLVTTRYSDITRNMWATKTHNVEKMNNNDGWVLFCNKVFGDDGEEAERLGLKDIGVQIVEKCDGLPLAIKAIAGVLRSKGTSKKEWDKLLGNHAWSMDRLPEELRGALYLSYVDLPSDLKQCFLYCSLFREDSDIYREGLIRYWIAEGFIQKDGDDTLLEDIAEDYYDELIRRSLLQLVSLDSYKKNCRMHDLLRSLAQFLIGEENLCIDSDAAERRLLNANSLRSVRRLSFVSTWEMTTLISDGVRENIRGLRSLLWNGEYVTTLPPDVRPMLEGDDLLWNGKYRTTLPSDVRTMLEGDDLVKNLRCLRVLNLSRSRIEKLPDSVGKLVHLRYLNLSCTSIDILPESIVNLANLQVLCLSECENLHFLPNGITQLSNLRCLDVDWTPLVYLPKGFDQLKQLNRLHGFFVGDTGSSSKACKIEELQPLSKLRELSIFKLERVTTGTSILTNKQFLRELKLSFSDPGEDGFQCGETEIKIIKNVMEELCPPSNLEELEIAGYPGCRFPRWIPLYNGFSRLENVELNGCKSCTQLPPLGQLPQLKRLEIYNADSIVTVGPELFFGGTTGTGDGAFSKLNYLLFLGMASWEEWELSYDECLHKGKLLPCLKELDVSICPKLRSLPSGLRHATSLQRLSIKYADRIQEVKNLPFLTEYLEVENCRCLREIQHLPLLRELQISYCPQLTRVSDLDSLQKLTLHLDSKAEGLPDWVSELDHERQQRKAKPDFEFQLECWSIEQLERCREGGEDWPIINLLQFQRVHILSYDGGESLTIVNNIQVPDVV